MAYAGERCRCGVPPGANPPFLVISSFRDESSVPRDESFIEKTASFFLIDFLVKNEIRVS
jgi:hypothetical protein